MSSGNPAKVAAIVDSLAATMRHEAIQTEEEFLTNEPKEAVEFCGDQDCELCWFVVSPYMEENW